jgi:hypothetical protein
MHSTGPTIDLIGRLLVDEQPRVVIDDCLLQHACGEFLEMPGLRLTCPQAQRLWGLDEPTCRELLEFLVDAKFLRRSSGGMYARTSDGVAETPRLRMARSDIHGRTLPHVKEAG